MKFDLLIPDPAKDPTVDMMADFVLPLIEYVELPVARCVRLVAQLDNAIAAGKSTAIVRQDLVRELDDLREIVRQPFHPTATRVLLGHLLDSYLQAARWQSGAFDVTCLALLSTPSTTAAKGIDLGDMLDVTKPARSYPAFAPQIVAMAVWSILSRRKFVPAPAEVLEACQAEYDRIIDIGVTAARKLGLPTAQRGGARYVKTA